MRALIVGGGGMLGRALSAGAAAAGVDVVAALRRVDCDITVPGAIDPLLLHHKPDVVFNAAAYTDVERAEQEPDAAFRANALGPETLARACAERGVKLVHYSTDFVFDGALDRPYDEFDLPAPQSVYARSKLAGERLVSAACPTSFVVRVGWLYGRDGRNFPSTVARRLRAGELIRSDSERRGAPTWVVPVAAASFALARTGYFGLYHCTAAGETTWAGFARFVAGTLGIPDAPVEALPTSAFPLKARRPAQSVLENRMLRLRGLEPLADWREQALAYVASECATPA